MAVLLLTTTPLFGYKRPRVQQKLVSAYESICTGVSSAAGPLLLRNVTLATGDLYQFGVLHGRSLALLAKAFADQGDELVTAAWGFDTFTGMPKLKSKGEITLLGDWAPGTLSSGGVDAVQKVRSYVRRSAPHTPVEFIVGRYDQTLRSSLKAERAMRAAAYVDIDCDTYSGAVAALDWLFASGLVRVGTVIGYDDFWVIPCSLYDPHVLAYGEARAHAEMAAKYLVSFRCLCGPCAPQPGLRAGWRTYFVVESLGSAVDAGLQLDEEGAKEFLRPSRPWLGEAPSQCKQRDGVGNGTWAAWRDTASAGAGAGGAAAVRCCANRGNEAVAQCVSACHRVQVGNIAHSMHRVEPLTAIDGMMANASAAKTECAAQGRRLCSAGELQSGACCRTGCAMDKLGVWNSDGRIVPGCPARPGH